ncbi:hypothetical protein BKA69DRAFT_1168287 [Paraphysoderma sedebokerense]|nr:hypothetical protein BKA69DRAFT_1168287 [Paraphysoderma sedebokerense]
MMFKRHTVKLLLIGLSLGLLASASELTKSNVDDEQEASSVIKLVDKDGDDRFYTTDDIHSAQSRAMSKDAECGGRRSKTRHQPITCSIFIDSSKLSDLRKYYFPFAYQMASTGEKIYLRHDEDALEKWESILYRMSNGLAETEENGQTTQTLRFAKLADWAQRDWKTPMLEAAWPKRILKHMKAICKATDKVTVNDQFFERSVEYLELVENSSAPGKEVDPLWGPIQGSKFFQKGNADKLPEIWR